MVPTFDPPVYGWGEAARFEEALQPGARGPGISDFGRLDTVVAVVCGRVTGEREADGMKGLPCQYLHYVILLLNYIPYIIYYVINIKLSTLLLTTIHKHGHGRVPWSYWQAGLPSLAGHCQSGWNGPSP
jgi:hypothetical protein